MSKKSSQGIGLALILVGLVVVLSFPGLAGADGGGANGQPLPPATGWATGGPLGDGYGVIIHTADGGQTWVRQGKPGEIPDVGLSKVAAIDAQNAWVVGGPADGYGLILRTRDGGQTWQRQGSPTELAGMDLWGVYALDGRTAWVTGSPGVILHTSDGGQTWTRQGQGTIPPQADVMGIYASDADHAWVVSSSSPIGIWRTTDGGASWQQVPYTCDHCGWLIWVDGLDSETVWVSGNGAVLHTADGGQTWFDRTPHGFGDYNELVALDRDTIWTVLDPAAIFRSDDAGANWNEQLSIPGERSIAISAMDGQTAWVVGVGQFDWLAGSVQFTSDGGQTWTSQDTPVPGGWYGVSFVRPLPPPPPEPPAPETPFVPEASTLLLLGGGLTGLAGYAGLQWRARRKN